MGRAVVVLEVGYRRVVRRSYGGDGFERDGMYWLGGQLVVVRGRQRRKRKRVGCNGIGRACHRRPMMRRPSLGLLVIYSKNQDQELSRQMSWHC